MPKFCRLRVTQFMRTHLDRATLEDLNLSGDGRDDRHGPAWPAGDTSMPRIVRDKRYGGG